MNFSTMYYLIDVVSNIGTTMKIFLFLLTVASILLFVFAGMEKSVNGDYKAPLKTAKKISLLLLLWFPCSFIPSKETMIIMYAGDQVQSILSSDKAKSLGGKAYEVLDLAMSEYLKGHKK